MRFSYVAMVTLLLLHSFNVSAEDTEDDKDRHKTGQQAPAPGEPGSDMQSVGSFKTPQLDSEEMDSVVLPAHLHCDACRAVTYQMGLKFWDVMHKPGNEYTTKKGVKKTKESAYLEAFDEVCHGRKGRNKDDTAGLGDSQTRVTVA